MSGTQCCCQSPSTAYLPSSYYAAGVTRDAPVSSMSPTATLPASLMVTGRVKQAAVVNSLPMGGSVLCFPEQGECSGKIRDHRSPKRGTHAGTAQKRGFGSLPT